MKDITQIDKGAVVNLVLFETPDVAHEKILAYLKEEGFDNATFSSYLDPVTHKAMLGLHADGKSVELEISPTRS